MSLSPFWTSAFAAFGADRIAIGGESRRAAGRPDKSLLFAPTPDCPLLVEALGLEAAGTHRAAWSGLVARALEPNVFLEPAFALSAAQHLASAGRPTFIMVWGLQAGGHRELLAVCPLTFPRRPFQWTASVWFHDLSTLGAPLLDRRYAGVALQAVLAWIARRLPDCGALQFHALRGDGPTVEVIEAVTRGTGRSVHWLEPRQRAALSAGAEQERAGLAAVSPKRAKEFSRQRRRLAEQGNLQYTSAHEGEELRDAVERFLQLEAKGWKGAKGTALLADPPRAAFARTMTRLLAREGQCRVDSLLLDGSAVASGIVLSSGRQAFFWKMAYDEDFAALSPGVQLVLHLTDAQRSRTDVDLTDSCAVPDHPMIDRLWLDRVPIVDAMVAVVPGNSVRFRTLAGLENGRRRLKTPAKKLLARLRSRHGH